MSTSAAPSFNPHHLTTMILQLPEDRTISEYADSDRDSMVANLSDGSAQEWTLLIPHPYTLPHADEWLAILKERRQRNGRATNWAIRDADGRAIGGIGFHPSAAGQEHAAELGYWLAAEHRGRGIMSAALGAVCDFGFRELGFSRLTAAIFAGNTGSAKVLERNGFQIEASLLRKAYRKNGRFIDAVLYAKIREA